MVAYIKAGVWRTTVKVQCRNEPPFEATIRFHPIPRRGSSSIIDPIIDCPHCGRSYALASDGEWLSDRPLVILES